MIELVNLGNRLKVIFRTENIPDHLPEAVQINFFRIIQGLLQNAIKHSEAENVLLEMKFANGRLSLTCKVQRKGFRYIVTYIRERPVEYMKQGDAAKRGATDRFCH